MAQERLIRARGYDPVLICFHEARRAKKEHGPKIGMQRFLQEKLKGLSRLSLLFLLSVTAPSWLTG